MRRVAWHTVSTSTAMALEKQIRQLCSFLGMLAILGRNILFLGGPAWNHVSFILLTRHYSVPLNITFILSSSNNLRQWLKSICVCDLWSLGLVCNQTHWGHLSVLCGGRHEPGLASAVVLQWVDLTPCGYCCSSVTAVLCVQVVLCILGFCMLWFRICRFNQSQVRL